MNTLRTSLSAVTNTALKRKAKQISPAVVARCFTRSATITSPSITSPSIASTCAGPSSTPLPLDVTSVNSNSEALQLLKSQPSHYAIASITGRTYLVSRGDLVTVPRLRDVQVGDLLLLDKVHEVGSRDYTLRAQDTLNTRRISTAVDLNPTCSSAAPTIQHGPSQAITPQSRRLFTRLALEDPRQRSSLLPLANTWSSRLLPNGLAHVGASLNTATVRVTAVVTENTKGALEKIVKKKKRKGYKKTVQHKQPYTRLRIEEITIRPN
ncbi:hypothetical protein NDA12_006090 [Ustilago hordei]|nr:hypothetical protein NDA15_007252 [Ustilago hordei]KAJ1574829.1 hypothetical protein NDA12_006090 [Ustilago hordei]